MSRGPLKPVDGHSVSIKDGKKSTSSSEYFAARTQRQFVPPRMGNHAKAYTDGRTAMEGMAEAIKAARKFIFIADWQMNFDTELTDRGNADHPGRLSELLAHAIERGVDVRVLLYDSIEAAAYTHENEAHATLRKLKGDRSRGNIEVGLHDPATGRADEFNIGFSHHQKILLVDGAVAFLGGLDIAHGRWDDGNFDVVADPRLHVLNDHYNGFYGKVRQMTPEERKLTMPGLGRGLNNRPGFAPPYLVPMTIATLRLRKLWDEGAALAEILSYADKAALKEHGERKLRSMVIPGYSQATALIRTLGGLLEAIRDYLAEADHKYREAVTAQNRALDELGNGNVLEAGRQQLDALKLVYRQKRSDLEEKFDELQATIRQAATLGRQAANRIGGYVTDPSAAEKDAQRLFDEALASVHDAREAFARLQTWLKDSKLDESQLLLEPGRHPRMPWQDVHVRLKGPVVFDVYKNFARRWNAMAHQNQSGIHAWLNEDTLENVNWLAEQSNRHLGSAIPRQTRLGRGLELTCLDAAWLQRMGGKRSAFGDVLRPGTAGNMKIQILRSAGTSLLRMEARAGKKAGLDTFDGDPGSEEAAQEQKRLEETASSQTVTIQDAMLHCIASAKAYIYIESQFFISDCGYADAEPGTRLREMVRHGRAAPMTPEEQKKHDRAKQVLGRVGGTVDATLPGQPAADTLEFRQGQRSPATNCIAEAVAKRINDAIVTGQRFHVYIVLPVHPEGSILNGAVQKQQYWIQQTLLRGRYSLIRRVCAYLVAKDRDIRPTSVREHEIRAELVKGRWKNYITVLNLRSYGLLSDRARDASYNPVGPETARYVVTDQCYVHSKLMIVDDAVAIIGSANTNDRSLNGDGDTEIAAVIVDQDTEVRDLGGTRVVTRRFARDLRIKLWRKFLGMDINIDLPFKTAGYTNSGDFPGSLHPPRGPVSKISPIKLEMPIDRATVTGIQALADANAKVYEAVFQNVPRNSMSQYISITKGFPQASTKVKNGRPTRMVKLNAQPPDLQPDYMAVPTRVLANGGTIPGRHNVEKAMKRLKEDVKGFWVTMPLDWGHGMNDPAPSLPGAIIADVEFDDAAAESTALAQVDQAVDSEEGELA